MFESTTQSRTRDAIRAAHEERSQVLARWLGLGRPKKEKTGPR